MSDRPLPTSAMDAVRQTLEEDGSLTTLLRTGQLDLAIAVIASTIRHMLRDRAAEMCLDPSDRRISDRLAQRIIQHPLFSYEEKEILLQVLVGAGDRAALAAVLAHADAAMRTGCMDLALTLTPDDVLH